MDLPSLGFDTASEIYLAAYSYTSSGDSSINYYERINPKASLVPAILSICEAVTEMFDQYYIVRSPIAFFSLPLSSSD